MVGTISHCRDYHRTGRADGSLPRTGHRPRANHSAPHRARPDPLVLARGESAPGTLHCAHSSSACSFSAKESLFRLPWCSAASTSPPRS
ncbi:hypothetical protein DSL92_04445 [Billgrantia gudaonensis]|uniref:Uncharacterized protein n=1 Tax=Billgrantia gudaonensis TaxID=376427 RepID=A0A3S0NHG9_9GAMM|nr:hypothetical protein DSL92_04445 [Halomonas gudaonensis]